MQCTTVTLPWERSVAKWWWWRWWTFRGVGFGAYAAWIPSVQPGAAVSMEDLFPSEYGKQPSRAMRCGSLDEGSVMLILLRLGELEDGY